MADGNVGNLWMSLGLKETVSKELNKIADGMTGVDAKTRKAQENLRKLADTDVSGKNISFLKKIQNALGDTSAEAKELQAVLGVIGKTKGGWKGITEDLNIGKLQQCAKLVQQLEFALTNIESKKGLSDSGFNLQSAIYQSREAIDAIASLQNHLKFADAPTASGLKAIRQELQGLINEGTSLIQSPIKNYTQIDKWLNTLDGKVTDIEYKYIVATQGVSKETNAVADAGKRAEEQTKKNAEAVNEQTNAFKKQEEQLKATTAAQKEKSAAESKAATAPKMQPFVEDKGLDKMLNDATRVTEKVEEQKKSLSGLSDAAGKASRDINEVLNKIVGGNAAGMSLDELAKKTARYSQELLALEIKLKNPKSKAETSPGKKGPDYSEVKSLEAKIKNAQIYLDIIQQIRLKKDELNATGAKQPNVNTKELERGKTLLDEFYGTLRKIVSENGVDGLMVLGNMPKALGGTMREIRSLLSSFSKENPLSVFANGADRAWTAISNLETKMRDLQRLMDEGKKMGYKTDMLPENFYELKRRLQETYRLFGDNSHRLTDKAYMENLFSDIAKTMKIAANAEREYGREKGKTIATNKEAEAAEKRNVAIVEAAVQRRIQARQREAERAAAAEREANRYAAESVNKAIAAKREQRRQEDRDNKQRLSEIKAAEARYDSLGNKVRSLRREFSRGISLGADVSKAEAEIHRLIDIMRYLRQMRTWLVEGQNVVGRIGSIGTGHDATQAGRALQDQKATNAAAQEAINKGVRRGIDLERERQQEIAKSAAKVRSDLAAALAGANAEASKMHGTLNDIKSLFLQGGIVYGAQSLFNAIVQTGGEIVQQHIALRSILGDVTKADELFAQTQELALRSPFKFGELNRDVKQLAAFGVEADSLYDTTKRLADIASGLGVSFGRLGLAYGQVKARSWLDGKELRQFAYAGLPLLQKITELYNSEGKNNKTNYKQSDVKEMISKRQVSFEDVQKVLWKMTDEGGQFYNMQLVLSETLLGQWNKLKDAWEIMLSRFAEGKNVIGGTFMFAIKGATDLLLTIDKLSPALLTFASVFLSKKLFGLASSRLGIGSIGRNLNDQAKIQLRNYAIEQQQLVLERKITQEIATQNVQKRAYWLADVQTQQAVMGRLALEGKLSILQMQKAVREGLITKELIDQLVIMGQITARQGEIILKGGTMAAVMNMTGSKLKGMLSFVGGWVGLTFMAVTQVISSIYNEFSAIKEKAESLQAPDSDWMKDYYDSLGAKKGTTDTELKKQIDSMKQLLIKSDAYTKTIDEQIKKAKDLNEQYDILREGVENAKNVASGDAGMIADAIGSTGGWKSGNPFNDTIEENLKDLQHSTDAYQLKLSAFDEATKSKMDSVASAILGAAGAGKTLEDKIRILADEGGQKWAVFQANMVKWNKNIGFSIKVLGNKANDVTSDINEIANDDVPRILNTIKKHLGIYGNDFKNWCKQNPERFRNMLLQIMDEAKWLIPQINKELEKITSFKFEPSGNKNSVTGKTVMQERVFENLRGNQKAYDLISSYIAEGSWYKTKNNAQSALQDLYDEMKSRQEGGASKASIAEAKKDYETLHKAVLQGFGYNFIPEDKKSNKVPKNKGDKKDDKELDELKRQLEDFKAARQAYQKLRKEAGMSRAKAKNEVFGLYKDLDWKKIDLDNYSGSIARLKDGFNFDKTNDRKKFRTQLDKENFEWRFSEELKPEWERVASNFKEALEKGVKQANLQKELYEKTGSLDFAKLAFQDGAVWDKQTRKMAEDFKKNFGHDVNLGMTEADAKVLYKDTPLALEAWQKITTLVKDNYVKSLQ